MQDKFKKITIIGCGHIGSSIAKAYRLKNKTSRLEAVESNPKYREILKNLDIIDDCHSYIGENISDSDLIIIATHLSSYKDVCIKCNKYCKSGAVVTDVGSCKEYAQQIMEKYLAKSVHVIPGHPVAGTEYSGPSAGMEAMFKNRYVLLTPKKSCDTKKLKMLTVFWQDCGAKVEIMSAKRHDRVMAITSHIPHLLAYVLVGSADSLQESMIKEHYPEDLQFGSKEVIKFSAGGFRDATRIAGSNPTMWRDIFINNKSAILEMSSRFIEDLVILQKAIRRDDGEKLLGWFNNTKKIRSKLVKLHQAGQFIPYEEDKLDSK